jgi:hypothetical protein
MALADAGAQVRKMAEVHHPRVRHRVLDEVLTERSYVFDRLLVLQWLHGR